MGGAENGDQPGQRSIGASTHVQRIGGQPGRFDADHLSQSRSQAAHDAAAYHYAKAGVLLLALSDANLDQGELALEDDAGRLPGLPGYVKPKAPADAGYAASEVILSPVEELVNMVSTIQTGGHNKARG